MNFKVQKYFSAMKCNKKPQTIARKCEKYIFIMKQALLVEVSVFTIFHSSFYYTMSEVQEILKSIESEFNENRALNKKLIEKLFDELKKFSNGGNAIKELSWWFCIGEDERHVVDSKECKKVFIIDFKKCWKVLNNLK